MGGGAEPPRSLMWTFIMGCLWTSVLGVSPNQCTTDNDCNIYAICLESLGLCNCPSGMTINTGTGDCEVNVQCTGDLACSDVCVAFNSGPELCLCPRNLELASDALNCVDVCNQGQYSNGSACVDCPANTTTALPGIESRDDCIEYCGDGEGFNFETLECKPCQQGFSSSDSQAFCYSDGLANVDKVDVKISVNMSTDNCSFFYFTPDFFHPGVAAILRSLFANPKDNYNTSGVCTSDSCENVNVTAMFEDDKLVCIPSPSCPNTTQCQEFNIPMVIGVYGVDDLILVRNSDPGKRRVSEALLENLRYPFQRSPSQGLVRSAQLRFKVSEIWVAPSQVGPGKLYVGFSIDWPYNPRLENETSAEYRNASRSISLMANGLLHFFLPKSGFLFSEVIIFRPSVDSDREYVFVTLSLFFSKRVGNETIFNLASFLLASHEQSGGSFGFPRLFGGMYIAHSEEDAEAGRSAIQWCDFFKRTGFPRCGFDMCVDVNGTSDCVERTCPPGKGFNLPEMECKDCDFPGPRVGDQLFCSCGLNETTHLVDVEIKLQGGTNRRNPFGEASATDYNRETTRIVQGILRRSNLCDHEDFCHKIHVEVESEDNRVIYEPSRRCDGLDLEDCHDFRTNYTIYGFSVPEKVYLSENETLCILDAIYGALYLMIHFVPPETRGFFVSLHSRFLLETAVSTVLPAVEPSTLYVGITLDWPFNPALRNETSGEYRNTSGLITFIADGLFHRYLPPSRFLYSDVVELESSENSEGVKVSVVLSLFFRQPVQNDTLFYLTSILVASHKRSGGEFGITPLINGIYIFHSEEDAEAGRPAINLCEYFEWTGYPWCSFDKCEVLNGTAECVERTCPPNKGFNLPTTECLDCVAPSNSDGDDLFCSCRFNETTEHVDVEIRLEGGMNTCQQFEEMDAKSYERNTTLFIRELFKESKTCQGGNFCNNMYVEVEKGGDKVRCKPAPSCDGVDLEDCHDFRVNFTVYAFSAPTKVYLSENETVCILDVMYGVLYLMINLAPPETRRSLVSLHSRFLLDTAEARILPAEEHRVCVTLHLNIPFSPDFSNESSNTLMMLNNAMGSNADAIFRRYLSYAGYLNAELEGIGPYEQQVGPPIVEYNVSVGFSRPVHDDVIFVMASVMVSSHEMANGTFGESDISFVDSMHIFECKSDAENLTSVIDWCDFLYRIGIPVCFPLECHESNAFFVCLPPTVGCPTGQGFDFHQLECENCRPPAVNDSEVYCHYPSDEEVNRIDLRLWIQVGTNDCERLKEWNPEQYNRESTNFLRMILLIKQLLNQISPICQSQLICGNIEVKVEELDGKIRCIPSTECTEDNSDHCFDYRTFYYVTFYDVPDLVSGSDFEGKRPVDQIILETLFLAFRVVPPEFKQILALYHGRYLPETAVFNKTDSERNELFITVFLTEEFTDSLNNEDSPQYQQLMSTIGVNAYGIFLYFLQGHGFLYSTIIGVQNASHDGENFIMLNASLVFSQPVSVEAKFLVASVIFSSFEPFGGEFGNTGISFGYESYMYDSFAAAVGGISAIDWCWFFRRIGFPICPLSHQCQMIGARMDCVERPCLNNTGLNLISMECETCEPVASNAPGDIFCSYEPDGEIASVDVTLNIKAHVNNCSFISSATNRELFTFGTTILLRSSLSSTDGGYLMEGLCHPNTGCSNVEVVIEGVGNDATCEPAPSCRDKEHCNCNEYTVSFTIYAKGVRPRVRLYSASNKTVDVTDALLLRLYLLAIEANPETRRFMILFHYHFLLHTARWDFKPAVTGCEIGSYFNGENCTSCGNDKMTLSRGAYEADHCIDKCLTNKGFSFSADPPACQTCPSGQSSSDRQQFCYYSSPQRPGFMDISVELEATTQNCSGIVPYPGNPSDFTPDITATDYVRTLLNQAYSGFCTTKSQCRNIFVNLKRNPAGQYICTPNCGNVPNSRCDDFRLTYEVTACNVLDKIWTNVEMGEHSYEGPQRDAREVLLQTLYFLRNPNNTYEKDEGVPKTFFPPISFLHGSVDYIARRAIASVNLDQQFPSDQSQINSVLDFVYHQIMTVFGTVSSFAYADFLHIGTYQRSGIPKLRAKVALFFKVDITQEIADGIAQILANAHEFNDGSFGQTGVALIGPVSLYQQDLDDNIINVYEKWCGLFPGFCEQGEKCQQFDVFIECVADVPTGGLTAQREFYPWGLLNGDKVVQNRETTATEEYFDNWLTISDKIVFKDPVPLGNSRFKFAHVLINGVITFGIRRWAWWPDLEYALSSSRTLLAPFWSLTNPKPGLKAFYQLYQEDVNVQGQSATQKMEVLRRASQEVNEVEGNDFNATTVLVVTWKDLEPNSWYTYYCSETAEIQEEEFRAEVIEYCEGERETTTFQALLISDGSNSYALVTYLQGAQKWKHVRGRPLAVGYVTSLKIGELGRTNYRKLTKLDRIVGSAGRIGTWLEHVGELDDAFTECTAFLRKNRHLITDQQFQSNVNQMLQCPCTLGLLARQWWFIDWKDDTIDNNAVIVCYTLSPIAKRTERLRNNTLNNLCCYRFHLPQRDDPWWVWWAAWTNSSYIGFRDPDGSHIITDSPWPWVGDPRRYRTENIDPKKLCCGFKNVQTCRLFNQVRPDIRCSNEREFLAGMAIGDPHIITMDNSTYTMNGVGEYVLILIEQVNFVVQGRTRRAMTINKTLSDATVFVAFAAQESPSSHFQVELNHERIRMNIEVNGDDISKEFYEDENFQSYYGTLEISRDNSNNRISVTALFESGCSVTINVGIENLEFSVQVPPALKGLGRGLLGNINGNPADDYVLPNGETLPPEQTQTERSIFFNFGRRCQVTDESSIFHYDLDTSVATFRNETFVPFFIEDATSADIEEAQTEAYCNSDNACVYDYLATRNRGFAEHSKNANEEAGNIQVVIANNPPNLTVNATALTEDGYWLVSEGVVTTIDVIGEDADDDSFSFELDGDFTGLEIDSGDGTITFTPNVEIPLHIGVRVRDFKGGVSAIEYITLLVCPQCSNHGDCDPLDLLDVKESGLFLIASCDCDEGYSGDFCEENHDACGDNPCAKGQECIDLPPGQQGNSSRGFVCGACPEGSVEQGGVCRDINECLNRTHPVCPAKSTCENSDGSYTCSCVQGYRFDDDDKCEDINECVERIHTCDHDCVNTDGDYNCTCASGNVLNDDGRTCRLDPSYDSICQTAGCKQVCEVDNGVATCACEAGYRIDPNDSTGCVDVDECSPSKPCQQGCNNTMGGFYCFCYSGYFLERDNVSCSECEESFYGKDCEQECTCFRGDCHPVRGCECHRGWKGDSCDEDINECSEPDACNSYQECVNTEGSYKCLCLPGYKMVDDECVDEDECADILENNCDVTLEKCINTVGSYDCICKKGYAKNSAGICVDIDECATSTHNCNHTCKNTIGNFNCKCFPGYALGLDRKSCIQETDVCASSDLTCDFACTLDQDTRQPVCVCGPGYRLSGTTSCVEINECEIDSLNLCELKESCNNTDGGYTCSCRPGYRLDNDKRHCIVCDAGTWGPNCQYNCSCSIDGAERCDPSEGCFCKSGYTGRYCDIDKDECASGELRCGAGQECNNLRGSASCNCQEGFEENERGDCVDVNECADDPTICPQRCLNINGGYICECFSGYIYNATSEQCDDVDECVLQTSGCEINCINRVGTFQCSCPDGFELASDSTGCIVTNECTTKRCYDRCAIVEGMETCFCPPGMEKDSGNDTNCLDVDLCSDTSCSDTCEESMDGSSFQCTCPDGKYLSSDGVRCLDCTEGRFGTGCQEICTCSSLNTRSCNKVNGTCSCKQGYAGDRCVDDINECLSGVTCPDNSQCENTNGSYVCKCNAGYYENNGSCVECDSNRYGVNCNGVCQCNSHNGDCNKVNGTCHCHSGWTGANCSVDINECSDSANNDCDEQNIPHLVCVNTLGSFQCKCDSGYEDNNNMCVDINECSIGAINLCQHSCVNTNGSFNCACNQGYQTTSGNRFNCEDINECTANTHNCSQVCQNTVGGFRCECNSGFRALTNDPTTCYPTAVVDFVVSLAVEISRYNLSDSGDYQRVLDLIYTPLLNLMQQLVPGLKELAINSLQSGSVIIDATTYIDNNIATSPASSMVEALIALAESGVVVNGSNVAATVILKGNTVSSTTSKCVILELIEPCATGYYCTLDSDGKAYCKLREDESGGESNILLIVGLAVGIPALFIIIALIVAVMYLKSKKSSSGRVSQSGYFKSESERPPSTTSSVSGPKLAFHSESSLVGSKTKLQDPLSMPPPEDNASNP